MQKAFAFLLFTLSFGLNVFSQQSTENADQLFKKAQKLAFDNHWKEARVVARTVLSLNDRYHDARVLIGRTYAWEQKYDSARVELRKVIAADSSYRDAIDALIDIEFWSENFAEALKECDCGLSFYPNDKDFLLKKAKILIAMGREEEARAVLAKLLNIDPNSYEVNALLASLKKYRNSIMVEHTFDFYNTPTTWRWHLTSIQYQRNTKIGAVIGKFNVGQLVASGQHYLSNPNYQVEADAYPVLNRSTYLYLNMGYSPNRFFPRFRAGLEPFKSFSAGWEASVGGRFLMIDNPPSYNYVYILTGSIGKYFSNNWASFRPYLTIANDKASISGYFYYRHYFGIPQNYIGAVLGYGVLPDNQYSNALIFSNNYLNSYHVRFDVQHRLAKQFLLRFTSEYIYEEYATNNYHNRFVNDLYLAFEF